LFRRQRGRCAHLKHFGHPPPVLGPALQRGFTASLHGPEVAVIDRICRGGAVIAPAVLRAAEHLQIGIRPGGKDVRGLWGAAGWDAIICAGGVAVRRQKRDPASFRRGRSPATVASPATTRTRLSEGTRVMRSRGMADLGGCEKPPLRWHSDRPAATPNGPKLTPPRHGPWVPRTTAPRPTTIERPRVRQSYLVFFAQSRYMSWYRDLRGATRSPCSGLLPYLAGGSFHSLCA